MRYWVVGLVMGVALAQTGLVLEQAGQLEPALVEYCRQLSRNSNDVGALQGLVRVSRALGRYDSLVAVSRRLVAAQPEEARFALALAEGLLGQGRTVDGLQEARRIGRKWPEELPALADLLVRTQQWAEATSVYRQIRERSGDPYAHADALIELYEKQAQFPAAVREIVILLNRNPKAFDNYRQKLRAYATRIGYRQLLAEIGELTAPDIRGLAAATVLLAANQQAEAVRAVQGVVDRSTLDRFARECEAAGYLQAALAAYQASGRTVDAGRVLRRMGRVAEARVELGRSNTAAALVELGELELEAGNYEAAEQAFSQALRLESASEPARFGLATSLVARGRPAAARSEARKPAAPSDRLLLLVAQTFLYEGKLDSVRSAIAELTSRFPASLLVNDALELALVAGSGDRAAELGQAMLDFASGRYEQALAQAQSLMKGNGQVAEQAHFVAAACLGRLGRAREALLVYDDLIRSAPASPLTPRARFEQAQVYGTVLKDDSRYRAALQQLVIDYPGSAYAPVARDLLSRTTGQAGDVR